MIALRTSPIKEKYTYLSKQLTTGDKIVAGHTATTRDDDRTHWHLEQHNEIGLHSTHRFLGVGFHQVDLPLAPTHIAHRNTQRLNNMPSHVCRLYILVREIQFNQVTPAFGNQWPTQRVEVGLFIRTKVFQLPQDMRARQSGMATEVYFNGRSKPAQVEPPFLPA